MNRLGFRPQAALAMAQRLRALPQVRLVTLMTHFATADDEARHCRPDGAFSAGGGCAGPAGQRGQFGSDLRHDSARARFIRPGIMLYGCSRRLPAKPANSQPARRP